MKDQCLVYSLSSNILNTCLVVVHREVFIIVVVGASPVDSCVTESLLTFRRLLLLGRDLLIVLFSEKFLAISVVLINYHFIRRNFICDHFDLQAVSLNEESPRYQLQDAYFDAATENHGNVYVIYAVFRKYYRIECHFLNDQDENDAYSILHLSDLLLLWARNHF